MKHEITVTGTIREDATGVRIVFSEDLHKLLNWHLLKATGKVMITPLYGSKISLYNPNAHSIEPDRRAMRRLNGKRVNVVLDISKARLRQSVKGYWVYFLQVDCPVVNDIIEQLGVGDNFYGMHQPHTSIANGKYFTQGMRYTVEDGFKPVGKIKKKGR
jgi:hypothetical protein